MSNIVFITIPYEIVEYYILPFIDDKIKMLLKKKYYILYHNKYYKFSYKYLIFLVKNNINICIDLLRDYKNFDIYKKEKIYYDGKIFNIVLDFCMYISRKFSSKDYYNYFINLYKCYNINDFSKLRIKQHKKFINRNILWIK